LIMIVPMAGPLAGKTRDEAERFTER
jgi:hypothetical protein